MVWPSAAEGQERFLLGWVLSSCPLQAWRRRPTFPAWHDPTPAAAPGAGGIGSNRRGVQCAPHRNDHGAGTSVGVGRAFALPPCGTRGLIHRSLRGHRHAGTRWAVQAGVRAGQCAGPANSLARGVAAALLGPPRSRRCLLCLLALKSQRVGLESPEPASGLWCMGMESAFSAEGRDVTYLLRKKPFRRRRFNVLNRGEPPCPGVSSLLGERRASLCGH